MFRFFLIHDKGQHVFMKKKLCMEGIEISNTRKKFLFSLIENDYWKRENDEFKESIPTRSRNKHQHVRAPKGNSYNFDLNNCAKYKNP